MATNGNTQQSYETHRMAAYAAPSLFQPHLARKAIRDAHEKKIAPLLVYYAGLSSVPLARIVAPMGFDAAWIDWEHTSCNVETMTQMVHDFMFLSQGRTIPFVRVPGHDHAAIGYALDAGASLIIPQVETVAQAQHCVSAAKFGAKNRGTRSAPPFRLFNGISDTPYDPTRDIWQCLNDQAAVIIQIESAQGIENLDAILTEVPDIDMVWLGALDARINMGFPGQFGMGGEPEWLAAKETFVSILQKHDMPYGGFAIAAPPFGDIETVRKASENMSFMGITADVLHLMSLVNDLKEAREVTGGFVKKD